MIKTRLLALLPHAKKHVACNVGLQWVSLLAQIVLVFSVAHLVEGIVFATSSAYDAWFVGAVVMLALAVRFACERAATHASYLASVDVKRVLRDMVYGKLLRLGAGYRSSVSTSEVLQLSTEGVEQLETYFGKYLPQLAYALLAPLTLFAALCPVSLPAALVLLACVPLIPVSIMVVQKIAKRLLNKYWSIYTGLGDGFLENLQGLTTLKIYQADGEKARQMDEQAQEFRRITMKVLTMQLNSTTVMDIVAYGGAAVGMIVAVSEFASGAVGFAGALSIVLLAAEFFLPMRLLGSYFHIAMNGMAASDKIFRLLDMEEPAKGTARLAFGDEPSAIQCDDVRFSYDGEREVLKGVSLTLPPCSFVSLVGESGSGKSTIAALLTGRERGWEGRIRIGGDDLRDVDEGDLMRAVTLVRHDSYLFKGTVEENLRMACPSVTPEQMRRALAKTNLLSFLDTQEGLSTQLAEQGSNLSGGQRQRLALARALLHDSPVYIFDEAASNIDAESEECIMRVVHELAQTKTVLLISHRLSNVVDSDCVLFLEDGEVREQGTHAELMELGGAYARLFDAQQELESYGARRHAGDAGTGEGEAPRVQVGGKARAGARDRAGGAAPQACAAAPSAARAAGTPKGVRGPSDDGPGVPARESLRPTRSSSHDAPERRGAFAIMGRLIGLVKPLAPVMVLAVLLGVAGYCCAIFLSIFAVQALVQGLGDNVHASLVSVQNEGFVGMLPTVLFAVMLVMAVGRGVLHYAEQYCNHYLAFRLLALIRHKVFAALRRLAPAKLEGKDKGDIISILTTDIELLEVFYAHTISPIAIAVITSVIMVAFLSTYHIAVAYFALVAYLVVGVAIPFFNEGKGRVPGMAFRTEFGELNAFVLDSLRGLDETIQYGQGDERARQMDERSAHLSGSQKELSRLEGLQRATSNLAILGFSFGIFFLCCYLYSEGVLAFDGVLTCTIAVMGSFGPVMAISALSNNLSQTLAAGERVLRVLEEQPQVPEVPSPEGEVEDGPFSGAVLRQVDFSYGDEAILENCSLDVPPGTIVGIHGPSGSGKSTLLKLLMRFWDAQAGSVEVSGTDVRRMPTARLRGMEGYVTQETQLFHDTIAANIAIGKLDATREEIEAAARKASIHDFVSALPQGYDTEVGELGNTLSGGERQRIGIARAFLHDAPFLLLDEPTSNLDALNEGIVLKSLHRERAGKTVVLVSHRDSTMNVADVVCEMETGRVS